MVTLFIIHRRHKTFFIFNAQKIGHVQSGKYDILAESPKINLVKNRAMVKVDLMFGGNEMTHSRFPSKVNEPLCRCQLLNTKNQRSPSHHYLTKNVYLYSMGTAAWLQSLLLRIYFETWQKLRAQILTSCQQNVSTFTKENF